LFFLGQIPFRTALYERFAIDPAIISTDKTVEDCAVSVIVVHGECEALRAADILEGVIANQADMPLGRVHLGLEGADPLDCGLQLAA
jgi:hypothetical protein